MNDASDAAAVVAAFGAAWAAHDLDKALTMITDDCVFDSTGPAAGQPIFDDTASRFEVEESIVCGDRVVERWCYSWDGGHIRGVDLFRVRDGLVAEKFAYVKG